MEDRKLDKPARRELLKSAALGAAAVTTVGLASGAALAGVPEDESKGAGYQETDHVRRYYESARD
ncbi:MAG: formate dehydrogenase [Alphaproteobacteria bacterium]